MKILMVHPQMSLYGGAEILVVRLAKYLMQQGHEVDILTLSTSEHTDYEGLNFILPLKGDQMHYRLRGSFSALLDVAKMYARLGYMCVDLAYEYDIVNPHNFPAIWSIPPYNKMVWICNELPDLWHNGNGRWYSALFGPCRFIDGFVVGAKKPWGVVPDSVCALAYSNRYGLSPHVVPYGIEPLVGNLQPPSLDKSFDILCPSMISPSKCQLDVLKAVRLLQKTLPNIRLFLAGYKDNTHTYFSDLLDYADLYHINLSYLGNLSREELGQVSSSCHAAVFAGRGQGSWLGPFEHLTVGTPILVSDRLTCANTIHEQSLGTVYNNLANALTTLYSNYTVLKNQALSSKEYVLKYMSWDHYCENIERIMIARCKGAQP